MAARIKGDIRSALRSVPWTDLLMGVVLVELGMLLGLAMTVELRW